MSPSSDSGTIKSAMSLNNILTSVEEPMEGVVESTEVAPEASTMSEAPVMATPSTEREASTSELSNLSHDSEFADDDPNVPREFRCMNDEFSECRTGQYTLKLSRKVISNHFGRNKACTRLIKDWPLFCRKHYQRATYKPGLWQKRKVSLINRQFDIIEKDFPGTTYTVSLKKSEMDRLNLFARSTDAGMSVDQAGEMVAPDPNIKSYQAPIDVLRELQHELGSNKSCEEVKAILAVINEMLCHNEIDEVPSIEFLPEMPSGKSPKGKSPKAVKPQESKAKSARISEKGAIQKPAST
jgi:hypothetical protein